MSQKSDKNYIKRRRWLAGVSVVIVLILAAALTFFVCRWLTSFSGEDFRDYIQSFGWWGWLVLLGLQFLQVFVALIPGELLESASGYAFGPIKGTLICYLGIALASSLIFLLVKRYGIRLVEVFISKEKIREFKFLKHKEKRNFLVFILFFIPGTPKDLITYFVGLTDMKLWEFLIISLVARIPSVVTSTVGGHFIGEKAYLGAIMLYGITFLVSVGGMCVYRMIVKHKQQKRINKNKNV